MLREAGIPFEVVPGITAGVAAPAYAGIPVTQRELASGVAFVTGHEDPAKPESALDWPALAAFPGTLVFYMGVRALPRIAEQLVAGGRSPEEPVAVVERGTLPGQRTLLATLADVAERAAAGGHPRARRSRSSGRWPRCASSSPGSSRARCTAARSPSRARARRPARWRARLRELGADGRRGAGDPDRAAAGRQARPRPLRPRRRHLARTAPSGCWRCCATRASSPGSRSRRSARAPRAPCASAGSSPTSCPSARSPRASSRRCATCRSRAR